MPHPSFVRCLLMLFCIVTVGNAYSQSMEIVEIDVSDQEKQTTVLFEPADEITIERLQPWLDENMPRWFENKSPVIRAGFIRVDVDELKSRLSDSWLEVQTGPKGDSAPSELRVDLFSGRSYLIEPTRYSIGSTGFVNISVDIVNVDGIGRQYLKFEISPDGQLYGRGVSSNGLYLLKPTPDLTTVVVLELDEGIVSHSIRVD